MHSDVEEQNKEEEEEEGGTRHYESVRKIENVYRSEYQVHVCTQLKLESHINNFYLIVIKNLLSFYCFSAFMLYMYILCIYIVALSVIDISHWLLFEHQPDQEKIFSKFFSSGKSSKLYVCYGGHQILKAWTFLKSTWVKKENNIKAHTHKYTVYQFF